MVQFDNCLFQISPAGKTPHKMPESQPDIANEARKQLLSLMRALGIQDDRPIMNEIVDKISEGETRLELLNILHILFGNICCIN